MALRLVQVNIKAGDDAALGRFWAAALGWAVRGAGSGATPVQPAGFVWPDPAAVTVDVVAVPDPGTVHDRVRLHLATTSVAHQAEVVARLVALGATPADVGQGDMPWTALADPEGNVFCVLDPQAGYRDTGPIAAVVVDCTEPRAMAGFWSAAMDWTVHEVSDEYASLRSVRGAGPYLEFLRTPEEHTAWTHVHLDLAPYPRDDQAAEVSRLRTLGATDLDVGQGDVPWQCPHRSGGQPVLRPHSALTRHSIVMRGSSTRRTVNPRRA